MNQRTRVVGILMLILLCTPFSLVNVYATEEVREEEKGVKVLDSMYVDIESGEVTEIFGFDGVDETKGDIYVRSSESAKPDYSMIKNPLALGKTTLTCDSSCTGALSSYTQSRALSETNFLIHHIFTSLDTYYESGSRYKYKQTENPSGTLTRSMSVRIEFTDKEVEIWGFSFSKCYSTHIYYEPGYETVTKDLTWNR